MEWNTLEELREELKKDNEVADSGELYDRIKGELDYNLEYAEDRVAQLNDTMDKKLYANCLSTKKYKNQQVKSTTDPLSEEESYTQHLDKLADYILRATYDNEEDRFDTERLKEEQKEIKKIKDVETRRKKLMANRDARSIRQSLLSNKKTSTSQSANPVSLNHTNLEDTYFYQGVETPVHYTRVDKELNQKGNFKNSLRYWLHYGVNNNRDGNSSFNVDYSVPYYLIAFTSLDQQNEAIGVLMNQIAETTSNDRRKQLESLKRELTAEYNFMAERFRSPVELSMSTPSEGVDSLTLIEERVDYTNKAVVKAIVYGYAELKQRYHNTTDSLHWCIIKDFEQAFKNIKLGKVQRTVAQHVVNNHNWRYDDIIEEISKTHFKVITREAVAYHINNFINKLLQYFIEESISYEKNLIISTI